MSSQCVSVGAHPTRVRVQASVVRRLQVPICANQSPIAERWSPLSQQKISASQGFALVRRLVVCRCSSLFVREKTSAPMVSDANNLGEQRKKGI